MQYIKGVMKMTTITCKYCKKVWDIPDNMELVQCTCDMEPIIDYKEVDENDGSE